MSPRRILGYVLVSGAMTLPLGAQPLLEWEGLAAGPHAVGFRTATAVDATRTLGAPTDYLGRPHPDYGQRPLHIAIWYPAASASSGGPMTYGDYLPELAWVGGPGQDGAAARQAAELAYIQAVTPQASPPDPLCMERLRGRPVWARRDARPAPGRFPVLIYAPGGGYPAFDNSALCEYLASHGYVVMASPSVGADAGRMTYDAFGLDAQTRDLEFLAGYAQSCPEVDAERIATAGFSSGGVASVHLALRNARVKALISLDAAIRHPAYLQMARTFPHFDPQRLRIPTLLMTPAPERTLPGFSDESFVEQARYADITRVVVPATDHHDFASMSSLLRRCAQPGAAKDWAPATAGYEAICEIVRGFLDASLKGSEAGLKDQTLCTITFVPARKAPPTPADFLEILRVDGPARAAEILRAAARETPEALAYFEGTLNQAGYGLLGAGRAADAVTILALAAEIFPQSINALDSLGEACLTAGDLDRAERCYREVKARLARAEDLSPEARAQYAASADRALAEIAGRRAR